MVWAVSPCCVASGPSGLSLGRLSGASSPAFSGFIRCCVAARDVLLSGRLAFAFLESIPPVRETGPSDPKWDSRVLACWFCCGTGLRTHYVPAFVPSHSARRQIYRGSKEEEAKRAMADASPWLLCRRSSVNGKREISRFSVVPSNPRFEPRSISVGESDAAKVDVVELVLAVKVGLVPFK